MYVFMHKILECCLPLLAQNDVENTTDVCSNSFQRGLQSAVESVTAFQKTRTANCLSFIST